MTANIPTFTNYFNHCLDNNIDYLLFSDPTWIDHWQELQSCSD